MTHTAPTLTTTFESMLLAPVIREGEPGAVIAVYRNGELLAHASRGVADTRTGDLLSEHTLMNIASVSKQLVAATILLAARRGELDLDADIRDLVPEITIPGVTIRGCLTHTAGLSDYFAASDPAGMPEIEIASLERFLRWLYTVAEGDFLPGSSQSYSNTGYVAAALAAERASGTIFPELIRDTLFTPLGMDRTFITTVLGEFVPGMAMSYELGAGHEFVLETMGVGEVAPVRGVNGDGEVITSIAEFGAWHGFLSDGRVLGTDIRDQLLERAILTDGQVSNYALGITHETVGGITVLAHSGGMWGFRAHSLVDPESGLSAVCFANRGDVDPEELAWRALRAAKGEDEISGHWFSTSFARGAVLQLHASGELSFAETGDPEGASRLQRSAVGSWAGNADGATVTVDGDEVRISSWAGVSERYERLLPAGAAPAHAVGAYREPHFGAEVRLELREEELFIVRGPKDAERILPFGTRNGEWIGDTTRGWVLIGTKPGSPVRLGAETFFATLAPIGRD